MTDLYGIGAGVTGAAQVFFTMARRTGRTTNLLATLKDGDRVVCLDSPHARFIRREIKRRGLNVDALVISPDHPRDIFQMPPSKGRTILDHPWVEEFYRREIALAGERIARIEREASGFGEAHRETQGAAAEIRARFREWIP